MVHAHRDAENLAADPVFGDGVDQLAVGAPAPQPRGIHRNHAAPAIERVDRRQIGAGAPSAQCERSTCRSLRPVGGQPQAVGFGRVDEQLLGRLGDDHMGLVDIEGDVALARSLLEQAGGDRGRVREGLAGDQAPPATIDNGLAGQVV